MFVKGLIGDIQVTLATIYAPNDDQDLFVGWTIDRLLEFTESKLILSGDFNVSLIHSVDTSSGSFFVSPGSRKLIAQSIHRAQLVDVWRLQHLGKATIHFTHPSIKSTPE